MPTIYDNREVLAMSVDDADALFQQIAETIILATAMAAKYEKEIALIKAKAAKAQTEFDNIIAPNAQKLKDYVSNNSSRFEKPRQRKTPFGKYGLRSVTKIYVDDELSAIASLKAQGIPAIVVTEKIDKKALEKAISDGEKITGVAIRTGELVKYDVDTTLINKAKKGA